MPHYTVTLFKTLKIDADNPEQARQAARFEGNADDSFRSRIDAVEENGDRPEPRNFLCWISNVEKYLVTIRARDEDDIHQITCEQLYEIIKDRWTDTDECQTGIDHIYPFDPDNQNDAPDYDAVPKEA